MEVHLITGHSDQNTKEMWQILTATKELIKTTSFREEGFNKLQNIDAEELTPEQQIFYYYIRGKYYMLSYRDAEHKEIEVLSWANDCYSDMVSIAFENDIHIKNTKRHFARAYCKYLIAQAHSSEEIKDKLLVKVGQIVETALRYNPNNSSFLFLQSQL